MDDDFHIAKNDLGVPLRKSISAWVLFKANGKCYAQWYEYGYEYAGGGSYARELSQWEMNYADYYITAQTKQGKEYLHSGEKFELDCNTVK